MALKCDRLPVSYLGSMHNYPIMLCISSENYSYTSSVNNYIIIIIILLNYNTIIRVRKLKSIIIMIILNYNYTSCLNFNFRTRFSDHWSRREKLSCGRQ